MRNHFVRAAAGNQGNPITWVNAVSGSGRYFVSPTMSVSVDDVVVAITSGNQADSNAYTGTATKASSSPTWSLSGGFIAGDGGNDYLISDIISNGTAGFNKITGAGTVGIEDTNDRFAAGIVVAFNGVDLSSYGVDQDETLGLSSGTSSLSLTGLTPNDLLVYIETIQDGTTYPTLPSGFTNAGADETWVVGQGGNAVDWYIRVGYLEGPTSDFSHTVTHTGLSSAAAVFRVYNI